MSEGPGRITRIRLGWLGGGGLVQAALDSAGCAWARVIMDGTWTPWAAVASGCGDVDIAAGHGDSNPVALVAVTRDASSATEVHALAADGTVTGTQF